MISRPRFTVLMVLLALVFALLVLRWPSPSAFKLLADSKDSIAFEKATLLKDTLAQHGIHVTVVDTQGTAHNLRLLREATEPTAALVDAVSATRHSKQDNADGMAGHREGGQDESFTSLGAMYLQPIWVFKLSGTPFDGLASHRDGKLGVDSEEGSSKRLAELIFPQYSDNPDLELIALISGDEILRAEMALDALRNASIAAVLLVGHPGKTPIEGLLRAEEIQVVSIQRTEAFALHFPFLTPIRLPQAMVDLRANLPAEDVTTLAASTEIVVNGQFPAAFVEPVLHASRSVYGSDTLFAPRGTFPGPDMASFPLNAAAERYYNEGPSLLRKVLPYWLATWVDRFFAIAVSLGTLMFGVFSLLPKLVFALLQRHLSSAYREMEVIEKDLVAGVDRTELLGRIDELDKRTSTIRIAMHSHASSWLELRQYLYDLKERILNGS